MEKRNLLGTGEKVTLDSYYNLAKRLAAFCPCSRDLWNFELERDALGYLVEEISKQQSLQDVTCVLLKALHFKGKQHQSSENLQPDDAVEKKNPFFFFFEMEFHSCYPG